jgi:ATP-dependent exoDNAse (exonuclease V) beta subunit
MCVLYVALTRAVHAMHILIAPIKETEKVVPKTFAGLLRAALVSDAAFKVGKLFEHGQPNWFGLSHPQATAANPSTPASLPSLPKIQLAPALPDRRRGLQRESPSQLEGGTVAKQRRVFELVDHDRELAMLRGTAFHTFFEQILWLEESACSAEQYLAALRRVPDLVRTTPAQQQAWLQEFRQALAKPDVAAVLTRHQYRPPLVAKWPELANAELVVHNEWAFASITQTQMLQGRMDRVVLWRQAEKVVAVDVLDYKTDLITQEPGQTLIERTEHYRPQLEAYRATLAARFALPPDRIATTLIFVGPGKVVR